MIKLLKSLGIAAALGVLFSQGAVAATVQIVVRDGNGNFCNFNVTTPTDITGNLNWNNVICNQSDGVLCATVTAANALKVDSITAGGATAALQGTNTATTAHTCSIAGYSILGCLGQLDDDARGPIPAGTNAIGTFNPTTIGSWGLQVSTQNSAVPTNGQLSLGQFNTTPTTITSGNVSPLQVDASGNLNVNIRAGAAAGGTSSTFGAAFPGSGTAIGMSQGGNMIATTGTAGNLNVQCANCSGSGITTVDQAPFVGSTSLFAGGGGFFQNTATNNPLAAGQQGMFQLTAQRALFANLRNATGTEIGTATTPLAVTGTGGTFPVSPAVIGAWGLTAATQNSAPPTNGNLTLGQFNTTPATISTGNTSPLQLDATGNLLVAIRSGAGSGGTSLGDTAGFIQGTTSFTPTGCYFNSAPSTLTSGQGGVFRCTNDRTLVVTVANANANGQAAMAASSPVVIASNQSAVPVSAAATTLTDVVNMSPLIGAAPSTRAAYMGAKASGATGGLVRDLINCDRHAFRHITTATDTNIVQGVAGQTVFICGWRSRAAGIATWFLENTASVNANCASANTQITGVATEAANTGETMLASFWSGLNNTSGNGLCINSTGTGGLDVDVWYAQF